MGIVDVGRETTRGVTDPEVQVESDDSEFDEACISSLTLEKIRVGQRDELDHRILDILWCGSDYTIYLSERGVSVHFANCPKRAQRQRLAFTHIAPELCELRALTDRFPRSKHSVKRWSSWLGSRSEDRDLFNHNIAQAIMLTMENESSTRREFLGLR